MQSGDEGGTESVLSGGALSASSTALPCSVVTSSYTWRSELVKTLRKAKRKVNEGYLYPSLLLAEGCSCAGMGLH